MDVIAGIAGLVLFSAVKFFFAVPAIVLAGYNWLSTFLISSGGGFLGVTVFFYFGEWLKHLFIRKGWWKVKADKKNFSKRNRRIVKIKQAYGLIGLAILTPCVFSIPLGALLAARYFDHDKKTYPVMLVSVLIWSLGLTTFYHVFK